MSSKELAIHVPSNRERADALLARIRPAGTPAAGLLKTADLATKVTTAMAPAMARFAERSDKGSRAYSSVTIEHQDADGSTTKVNVYVHMHGDK